MKGKILIGIKVFSLAAILLLGIVSIIASGGGSSSTAPVTKNYTGIATQAQIDEANAAALAVGAWLGGQLGTSLDIFGAVQAGPAPGGNSFSLGLMPLIFDDVIYSIGIPDIAVQPNAGIVTQEPFTIPGSCNVGPDPVIDGGATVASGATINETTGAFSFDISFNNFCEVPSGEPLILNGKVKMSGTLDPGSINNELPDLEKYTITFNSMTLEYFESGDTITIMGESSSKRGIFSADWTVTPNLVTMSYVIKDNSSDPVVTYWFKNVEIELEGGEGYTDLTGMTGSFYDPLYGFVVMSIGDVIHMLDGEYGPESGSLIVTGTGETKALLSFWGTNLFEIHADTTGDGVYDYSDPDNPYSWSEL